MANNFAKLRGLAAVKNGLDDIRRKWGDPATYEAYADAEHAPYVEYGTSRMDAQPYMRPAVDRVEGRIPNYAAQSSSTGEVTRNVALAIADEARRIVVVDTGELRDSIDTRKK